MKLSTQLANHFRQIYFGGNWTSVNLKQMLEDVTLEEATRQLADLNTILRLAYHIHYYVAAVTKVLQGGPLDAKDALSFNHPPVNTEAEWQSFLTQMWEEAANFALLIEKLPDEAISQIFIEEKYGTYYRNLQGIIEHTHYHLGQITIIKKLLRAK
jgi:uncharacterized damage-inducible protein DinB